MNRAPGESSDAIVDATLEVLGEVGLKSATTRAIAQRAGVNEVTLFRKFGSKKKLVAHVLEAVAERVAPEVRYTGDVEADLLRLVTDYQRVVDELGPVFSTLITDVARDPEMRGEFDGIQRIYERAAELLGRYQQEGLLRDEPLSSLVLAFGGPLVMRYVSPLFAGVREREPFDPAAHVDRFLHGRAGGSCEGR